MKRSFLILFLIIPFSASTSPTNVTATCESPEDVSDTCYLQLNVTNPDTLIQALSLNLSVPDYDHNVTLTTKNLTKLIIENQTMHYIPKNLKEFFSHVTEIKILRTGLKDISNSDINSFHNLEVLHVIGNDIEIIDSNLFDNLKNITEVNMTSNKLKQIAVNAFTSHSKKFKIVDLSNNICTKGKVHDWYNVANIQSALTKCNRLDALEFQMKELQDQMNEIKALIEELSKFNENLDTNQTHISNNHNEHVSSISIQIIGIFVGLALLCIFFVILAFRDQRKRTYHLKAEKQKDFTFKEVEDNQANDQLMQAESFIKTTMERKKDVRIEGKDSHDV